MNLEILKKRLIREEGSKRNLYQDTVQKWTIGVGHNLSDKPISQRAVDVIFEDDIFDCIQGLDRELPWWNELDDVRQNVLLEMVFNLGINGLLAWKNTLNAIKNADYLVAADKMRNSKAASQTGKRYLELAQMMETGKFERDSN